jgi:peptide subunit release factor 1 (eRF1)
MGTPVELISIETQEGNQFYETFGGIAALLRYK